MAYHVDQENGRLEDESAALTPKELPVKNSSYSLFCQYTTTVTHNFTLFGKIGLARPNIPSAPSS